MGKPSPFPLKAINESGTVTTDVNLLRVPDSAISEQSGVIAIDTSTGDVTGPSSATDNAIARFNGTTGKTIQNSAGFVDDNGNIYGVNVAPGYALTTASLLDTQLTATSAGVQHFTGSAAGNNLLMPVVTTLPQTGISWVFINDTAGNIVLTSSGGNALLTIGPGGRATVTCILLTGTSAASWVVSNPMQGPASAVDNAITRYDGTTGKLVQSSAGRVDDSGNVYGVNVFGGESTTSVSTIGLALTVASARTQLFDGTSGGTDVLMPVVTTLPQVGMSWHFINKSNGNILITSSGGNAITTLAIGQSAIVTCILLTGTTAASWTVSQGPAFDANGVPYAANFTSGLSSTATAAGTTVLTVASSRVQVFTGSSTQTVTLPVVSTLPQVGYSFTIINNSDSGAITVNSSGGNLVQTVPIGARATVTCILLTGTTAASWVVSNPMQGPASAVDNAITRFDGTTGKLVQSSAGRLDDNGNVYGVNVFGGEATTSVSTIGLTLTVASVRTQVFSGTAGGTDVLMPVVTTLPQVGMSWHFINKSNGNILITSSGGNAITTLAIGQSAIVTCILLTGTTAASWTVSQGPAFDANGVPYAANFTSGLSSTVTAAGTTVLTVASSRVQVFTGSDTQTVTLPVVSTLPQVGYSFTIINNSDSGAITVNSSGGNLVQTVPIGCRATVVNNALTGTSADVWDKMFFPVASNTGAVSLTSPTFTTPIFGTGTPASAAAAGTQGQILWDASYIYVAVGSSQWKRVAIATW